MKPGKFEGNADQDLAEYLHKLSLDGWTDEEIGDVEGFGWYGLLTQVAGRGKLKSYIIHEDSQGFFNYTTYDTQDLALTAWGNLESEYEDFEREAK